MRTFLALLLVSTALAGCLSGDDEIVPDNGSNVGTNAGFESPFHLAEFDSFHNHSDPAHHDIANNITLEAFLPLGEGEFDPAPGYISEMHVAGDTLFLGVMRYGFQVIDISDPLHPVLMSTYDISVDGQEDETYETGNTIDDNTSEARENIDPACTPTYVPKVPNCYDGSVGIRRPYYVADLKSDESGDWLFLTLEGVEKSANNGVFIYDVSDKANPVFSGYWPAPGNSLSRLQGCHMIEIAEIDEQEYIFCAPLDDSIHIGIIQPANDQGVRTIQEIAKWVPAGAEETPRQVEAVEPTDPTGTGEFSLRGGHQDMTWQLDPLDPERHILSASMWELGWYWIDVTNPAAPMTLGDWHGEDSELYEGNLHTAMMYATDDDRRIAVSIPEVAVPPVMFVMDVTDYEDPVLLAEWSAHDNWYGEDRRYSTHNFQLVEEKVYMTHYHAGNVVLDLSGDNLTDPQLVGTFTPMDRRPETYGYGYGGSWDVVVSKGYQYTANQAGLFVMHLNGEPIHDDYTGFA